MEGATPAETLPDARAFVDDQRSRPLRPFEALQPQDAEPREVADRVRERGWKYASMPPVPMRPPLAWDEVCASSRSWDFHLHSWDPLAPLLRAYDETSDRGYLDHASA